ncbi:DUF7448 domain-containing protein [Nocardia abscessus]|uniref:DUF7448 domain-containing protein n=1 Tax=Nocardia abscessus TaxID=120957 RepID=UPI002456CBBB|nr:hypothetical protein [Nocardia abscessus]
MHIENTDEVMQGSAEALRDVVIGRKIVRAEMSGDHTYLHLDNGTRVTLRDSSDCCAYTDLDAFFLDPASVDHAITGVRTEGDYSTWFIFADMGDIMKMDVSWSEGNGYYGYGFDIEVVPFEEG